MSLLREYVNGYSLEKFIWLSTKVILLGQQFKSRSKCRTNSPTYFLLEIISFIESTKKYYINSHIKVTALYNFCWKYKFINKTNILIWKNLMTFINQWYEIMWGIFLLLLNLCWSYWIFFHSFFSVPSW